MKIKKFLAASPLFNIYQAYVGTVEPFQTALKGEEVSFVQALILATLFFEEQPQRPSKLAETLRVSRSNMSHAISYLESRGWLKRTMTSTDARIYLLEMTANGKKKVLRLIKIFDRVQGGLEDKIGLKTLATMNLQLKEFVETYQTI